MESPSTPHTANALLGWRIPVRFPIALLFTIVAAGCGDIAAPALAPAYAIHAPPDEWVLHDGAYEARVVASGLSRAQGVTQLGSGILLAPQTFGPDFAEHSAQITRVLPSGRMQLFAALPPLPPRAAVPDIVPAPGGGYYASAFAGTIFFVGSNGAVREYANLTLPTFLAVGPDGRLYVNQVIGDVVRVEADGTLTRIVAARHLPSRLRGITFDEQGRLYVLANEFTSGAVTTLRRFVIADAELPMPLNAGENVTTGLPLPPSSATPIHDPVVWSTAGGDLFVVDPDNVYRVHSDGSVSVFISGLQRGSSSLILNALAITPSGELLVTEYAIGRVTAVRRRR